MNEHCFYNNLFRSSERVRVKNQVQEKLLNEAISGRKGFAKKLNDNLTKLEKSRKTIENELSSIEKEMQQLGLQHPSKENKTIAPINLLSLYPQPLSTSTSMDMSSSSPSRNESLNILNKRRHSLGISSSSSTTSSSATSTNSLYRTKRINSLDTNNSTLVKQLPKINEIYDRNKRKSSFTQVDLFELDIPKVLMHSNEAKEKYKFNPHYFLPNGEVRKKWSLPQLQHSMEMVKNSTFLRHNSIFQ